MVLRVQLCGVSEHKAVCLNEYSAEDGILVVSQSPYSPDLIPSDGFLFVKNQSPNPWSPF